VQRSAAATHIVEADIAVLGAGISGISAALEAARLGRKVVLIDGAPSLGGQAVGAVIGTFCGLFSNGPQPYQVTHGIADDMLRHLGDEGALHYINGRRNTTIVQYDETALARWVMQAVGASGVQLLLGALLHRVERDANRIHSASFVTRHGAVTVRATGFIDASGDAALAYESGFLCQQPEGPIYGTQMMVLESIDEAAVAAIDRKALERNLAQHGSRYGLLRHDGFVFAVPGKGRCLVNMTHIETPLEPLAASRLSLDGQAQADGLLRFLRDHYPAAFAHAAIRSYGQPGIRMTRWIVGRDHLTADAVRQGVRTTDAIARCSWPIELHDRSSGVHWEEFGDDHMHWVPLGCLIPREAENLMAAGRCIDGDPAALSSVRVMGPCIATGAAAAHALDLAGAGSVAQIDVAALQRRLADNLERRD
jgi:2-polyprenyl-6-methoxyphenol hydroxylase-like FAD-dependent oxidoreductase